jgi:2-oxoglutarate ferredoxin oxidoreductase subunit beta
VISNCHVQYGKKNKLGGAVDMLQSFKEQAVTVDRAAKMTPEELEDKTTIGVLVDRELPVSTEEYKKVRKLAQEGRGKI